MSQNLIHIQAFTYTIELATDWFVDSGIKSIDGKITIVRLQKKWNNLQLESGESFVQQRSIELQLQQSPFV
jgi:hypothetical protein